MREQVVIVGITSLVAGLLIGNMSAERRNEQSTKLPSNRRVYAMNVAISSMPFWSEPKHTWEKFGQIIPGLKTEFGGPSDSDPSKQIEELDKLSKQNLDGLVVFSTDPSALTHKIDAFVANNIPVVTVFADVPKSRRIAYVGTNQAESAKAVAKETIDAFRERIRPDTKALIVIGKVGAEDQDERRKGFEQELKSHMQLVAPVVDDYSAARATESIRASLNLHPELKFIFGCDSQSAIGAIAALKELGKKPGDVVVTGWDNDRAVLEEIKGDTAQHQGWIHATAVLYSAYMVETCLSILEANHFSFLSNGPLKSKPNLPSRIDVPMQIVTAKNVEELLQESKP